MPRLFSDSVYNQHYVCNQTSFPSARDILVKRGRRYWHSYLYYLSNVEDVPLRTHVECKLNLDEMKRATAEFVDSSY